MKAGSDGIMYRAIGNIGTEEHGIYDNIKSIQFVMSGSGNMYSYGVNYMMKYMKSGYINQSLFFNCFSSYFLRFYSYFRAFELYLKFKTFCIFMHKNS